MQRLFGWILVAGAALLGLLPLLTPATALQGGRVQLPTDEPAAYHLGATTALVACTVLSPITLTAGESTPVAFQCVNRWAAPVTITWSVADDGGGGFVWVAPGGEGATLPADGLPACHPVTLTAGAIEAGRTVVFRAQTGTGVGFYVSLHFDGQVTVQADGPEPGGGCP